MNSLSTVATRLNDSLTRRWPRNGLWLSLLLGACLSLLLAWVGGGAALFRPIVSVDIDQQRANIMLPVPRGPLQLEQSFYPRWNGLREVELVLARAGEPDASESGRLTIQLFDEQQHLVAEQVLATRSLSHNQSYTLRFPAQEASAGTRYVLRLTGSSENPVSVWGYSLDVYRRGQLAVVEGALDTGSVDAPAGDLRFVTRYELTWKDILFALGSLIYWEGALMLAALALMPLPGVLLLLALQQKRTPRLDRAVWWGCAFALGMALWPLLWLGLTLAGGRWQGWSLWLFMATGWILALALWLRIRSWSRQTSIRPVSVRLLIPQRPHVLLLLILLVSVAVRLLAVRDLMFPPWVDASRHALITAVMAETGRAPADYAPFLPVDRFPYHFGFHTLSASLSIMTRWPLNRLLLFLGQLINGMMPLSLYAAMWLLTKRQGPSLLAAFLVALPFFFPAYYVTWGRMTQLTAVFILPVLLAYTWLMIRGGRRWRRLWPVVAILAAGMFYVHLRVFLYYVPFAILVWLMSLGRNGRRVIASAALALLLAGPQLVRLLGVTEPLKTFGHTMSDYNAFPMSYVNTGWERQFLYLAAAGLLLTLVVALKRRSWAALPLALAGWVALLFLLLSGQRLGLPETSLVNLNSMYIMLFVPLALFIAVTVHRSWRWLNRSHPVGRTLGAAAAGGVLLLTSLFGIRQQVTILNSQTILARWQDLPALEWINANLPQEATFAVNSWLWLGSTWAGGDGGAWIVPLTGRASTTPPVDYTFEPQLFREVIAFNESATGVTDWTSSDAAQWLRQQGVTHIFVGARGGFFDPARLADNPSLKMVYGRNGAFIFAVEPGP